MITRTGISNRLLGRDSKKIQLRMAPMIDVVFLLLIFFLLTANFRSHEGFLPAELPGQLVRPAEPELEPLIITLHSTNNGGCVIEIGDKDSFLVGGQSGVGFEQLSTRLIAVLALQGRTSNDPIKLVPSDGTSWDHVVKAYNAIWQENISNIIFGVVKR